MTEPHDFSKDVEALRDELAALRADWSRATGKAETAGRRRQGAAKDAISSGVEALGERIAKEAGDAGEAIGKDMDGLAVLVETFATRARKTAAAHPLSSLFGALAIGFLLGRIAR